MAWEHKGYTIDVQHDGTFATKKDDFEANGNTLAEVRTAIDHEIKQTVSKKTLNLKVIGILRSDGWKCNKKRVGAIARGVITGINRTSRSLLIDGVPDAYRLDDIVADTPANESLLLAQVEAGRIADAAQKKVAAIEITKPYGYGRIEALNYATHIATLEKQYAESAAGHE